MRTQAQKDHRYLGLLLWKYKDMNNVHLSLRTLTPQRRRILVTFKKRYNVKSFSQALKLFESQTLLRKGEIRRKEK